MREGPAPRTTIREGSGEPADPGLIMSFRSFMLFVLAGIIGGLTANIIWRVVLLAILRDYFN